ncbi:succinate dehydrogenase, hydrophobic membrane anchor protein [Candidatus Methylospira mobilis]|nr:succinate dehydrogenase, hydrophobic membrane anchor protein [Candidatus Methylospira mobilis]WNV03527.1 succinate dehydrogenase, hydrophobic membrane anchor protein [Candidatus Methylospira mobilis]
MEKHYRTPLRFALGLGTSRSGTSHWWLQRASAAALIPLVLWFALSAASLPYATHAEIMHWLTLPWNTLILVFLLVVMFCHAAIGIQVVIDDYIHLRALKFFGLITAHLLLLLLASLAVYTLIRIIVFKG